MGGLGKSILACDRAARLSRGQLDGDCRGDPVSVIYVTAEDSWESTLVPRLMAAGADLDRIVDVELLTADGNEESLSLPEDLDELRDAIEQTGAKLVVIDPLVAFLSENIDSHNDKSVRRALAPLKRLAEETGAAIVCIVHLNKRDSRLAANRVIGSVGFYNAVRSVLLFTADHDEEHHRILSHAKANLGPQSVSLRFGVEGRTVTVESVGEIATVGLSFLGEAPDITADNALDHPDGEHRSALADAIAFLEEELAAGPVPAKPLLASAKRNGHSEKTVQRAKAKIGVVSRRDGDIWRWHLPEDGQHGQHGQENHV
jgi:hypothetical protein